MVMLSRGKVAGRMFDFAATRLSSIPRSVLQAHAQLTRSKLHTAITTPYHK